MSQGFRSEYQRQLDHALASAAQGKKAQYIVVDAGGTLIALHATEFAAILPVAQPATRFEVRHLACFCVHSGSEYAGLSLASLLHGKPITLTGASRVLVPFPDAQDESSKAVALVVDAVREFSAEAPDGIATYSYSHLTNQLLQKTSHDTNA